MTTLLLRAASAAAWSAVNGGATTISTSAMSFTRLRNSLTYFTVSATVLYIFQLPAMNGVRIGSVILNRNAECRHYPTRGIAEFCILNSALHLGQHGHARQRTAAQELQRGAAAGRDVRDRGRPRRPSSPRRSSRRRR